MIKTAILTEKQAYAIASLIDATLIDYIRNDVDVDSMEWLINVISGYTVMCDCSGYVGLTEHGKESD